jgi:hypothetical protein
LHIELTTGKDSFVRRGTSARRNVSVQTYVRVKQDGEGRKVVPLFAAFKNKLPGFGKSDTITSIPASDRFGTNAPGIWYVSRHEVLPGTEVLVEYTRRQNTGFQTAVEHMLIVAHPDAPLHRVRLDLPMHELSSVPNVFFEGRFYIVTEDDQLPAEAVAAWRKHLAHEDEEYQLSDVLDACQPPEDRFFFPIVMEREQKKLAKAKVTKTTVGAVTKIRRGRAIRVR